MLTSEQKQLVSATVPVLKENGVLLTKWLSDPAFKWNGGLLNKLVDILNTVDDDDYKQKIDDNNNFLLNLRARYTDFFLTANLPALPLTQTSPVCFLPPMLSSYI